MRLVPEHINPHQQHVDAWLSDMTPESVHEETWIEVNKRYPGVTRALRAFINEHYDPEVSKEIYDGIALGLGAILHAEQTAELQTRLFPDGTQQPSTSEQVAQGADSNTAL